MESEVTNIPAGLNPNQAFKSFFADPEWRMKALIGGIFGAIGFFLFFLHPLTIPFSFCFWGLLTGYYLRVIRTKIVDINSPLPQWNDWLDLLISGITWIAVSFGQIMLPLSISTVLFLIATTGGRAFMASNTYPAWVLTFVLGSMFVWIVVALVSTIVMANFAHSERMSAAFDFFTVGRKLRTGALIFTQTWLLMVGIQALGVLIPAFSVLGLFLIPNCAFIATCVASTLLAQAWRASEAS